MERDDDGIDINTVTSIPVDYKLDCLDWWSRSRNPVLRVALTIVALIAALVLALALHVPYRVLVATPLQSTQQR